MGEIENQLQKQAKSFISHHMLFIFTSLLPANKHYLSNNNNTKLHRYCCEIIFNVLLYVKVHYKLVAMATLSTITNFSNINKKAIFYLKVQPLCPKRKEFHQQLSQMSEKLKGKF